MQLITVAELSRLIHKAESSIYSDLIRNPLSLPPVLRIPGSRRVLFKDVDIWLEGLSQPTPIPPPASMKSVRGRPSKKEQILKRQTINKSIGGTVHG